MFYLLLPKIMNAILFLVAPQNFCAVNEIRYGLFYTKVSLF